MFELAGAIGDPHAHLAAVCQVLDQRVEIPPAASPRPVEQHGGGLRNGARIGTVVLGQPALCPGEQADPLGIEPYDLEATRLEGVDHRDLIPAGGLQADAYDPVLGEPGGKLVVPGGGAVDLQFGVVRPERDIQPSLADIDAGGDYHLCHLPIPSLQIRSWRPCNCSGCEDGEAAPCSPAVLCQGRNGLVSPGPARRPPRRPALALAQFRDTRSTDLRDPGAAWGALSLW